MIKKEANNIFNTKALQQKEAYVECKNRNDTNHNRDTGTISQSFRKYLSNIPGKNDITELQKTTILGTAHILQRVLIQKYKTSCEIVLHVP